jgi:hypothetical protein
MNKKSLAEFLIQIGSTYGLHLPRWEERLNRALDLVDEHEERNKFEALDTACPALTFNKEGYFCVWARFLKPPQSKKLGGTVELATALCVACDKTRKMLDGIADYEDQIKALKSEVGRGVVVEVPVCEIKSKLNDDGTEFFCERQRKNMKVTGCKTLRKGAPCKDLRWIALNAKGKFGDAPER